MPKELPYFRGPRFRRRGEACAGTMVAAARAIIPFSSNDSLCSLRQADVHQAIVVCRARPDY